ncbi:MAG: transposase [bacterium]
MKRKRKLRLNHYNYISNGYYFVTICTYYNRPYLVGKNRDVVARFIEQIASKTEGVALDYYVLMPTHTHLILTLEKSELRLGEVIRRIKAVTSKETQMKLWQPNYYEHIIRNENALNRIREYIINNPLAEKIKFEQFYK